MGRYYYTDTGREGKFMFAVQPSDDPQYLGMSEEDPSTIHYYASDNKVEEIKEKLDEQYDILGIDKKDRIYDKPRNEQGRDDYNAYEEWEYKILYPETWVDKKYDEMTEEEKESAHWVSRKGDEYAAIEIDGDKTLALARIRLALTILADIKDEGYCSLDAEC